MLTDEQKNKIKKLIEDYEVDTSDLTSLRRDEDSGYEYWDEDEELYLQCEWFLQDVEGWCEELGFVDENGESTVDLKEVERFVWDLQPKNRWESRADYEDRLYDEWSRK